MKATFKAALLAAAFVGACAPIDQYRENAFQAAPEEPAILIVHNNYWTETTVYAVNHGFRTRLGTVRSGEKLELKVPRHLVTADLRFQADPVGPEDPVTFPRLMITPNATVELNLATNLHLSNFMVR